jgi:membrane associated rhomboid family serine protease
LSLAAAGGKRARLGSVLLPIGHDRDIYEKPYVTIGIMLTCTLLQVVSTVVQYATRGATELSPYDPISWLGHVPSHGFGLGLVTSAFAHAGFMHLIGNMIFLWLTGASMEYRWGWKAWGGLYLAGAFVSAATFTVLHPEGTVPLVGASGAVAAAMGAFLVCLYNARIKFWYFYLLFLVPRTGTFTAPAYVALPIWFVLQLAQAYVFESGGGGTAYSAHVGGFVFGASVALVLRLTGLEDKLRAAVGSDVFDEEGAFLAAPAAPVGPPRQLSSRPAPAVVPLAAMGSVPPALARQTSSAPPARTADSVPPGRSTSSLPPPPGAHSAPPASSSASMPWLLGPRVRSNAPPRLEEPIDIDLGSVEPDERADEIAQAVDAGDAATVRELASAFIEATAEERQHEVLPLVRRIQRRFGAELPLGDRALAVVVNLAAHEDDADVALAATRVLIVRYPRSPHVAAAMFEAAGVQRRSGLHDKANNTLRNLITAYPDNPLAARARRMLEH